MSDAIPGSEVNILTNPSASQFLGGALSLIPFSLLFVAMRFWARHCQRQPLKPDDWFVVPALVGNLVLAGLAIWAHVSHSLGYQTPQAPPGTDPLEFVNEKIAIGKKLSWCMEMMQSITLTCTKLSLLFLYRRIFHAGQKNAFHWASILLIGLSSLWGLTFFFCLMFVCKGHNPGLVWVNIQTLNEYCGIWEYFSFSFAVSDAIIDLFIFVLPFVMVFSLRMSMAKKLATASMFFIGILALITVALRAYVLAKAAFVALSLYTVSKKGASNSPVTSQVLWGCIESTATIAAVCLPAIYAPARELVKRWRGKHASRAASSSWERSSPSAYRRWPTFGGRQGISDTITTGSLNDNLDDRLPDSIPMVTDVFSKRHQASSNAASTDTMCESDDEGQGPHIRVEHTIEQIVYSRV